MSTQSKCSYHKVIFKVTCELAKGKKDILLVRLSHVGVQGYTKPMHQMQVLVKVDQCLFIKIDSEACQIANVFTPIYSFQ